MYWFANVLCNICYRYIHCYTTCFTTTKNKTISEYEYMNFLAFGPIAAHILVWPLYYWNIRYPYVIPFDSLIASLLSVYYFISPKYFTRYKISYDILWYKAKKYNLYNFNFSFLENYWFRMNDLYEWNRDAFCRKKVKIIF